MSLLEMAIPGWGQMTATIRAIRAGIMAALVIIPALGWAITAHTLHGVRGWQANVVAVTSTAGHVIDKKGRPALIETKAVPDQIRKLGEALDKVATAQTIAAAGNVANNTRIGGEQAAIGKKAETDHADNLSRNRADADAYVERMRGAAPGSLDQHPADAAQGATTATAPGEPDGAARVLVMASDVRACTDNFTTLTDLQGWVRSVTAIKLDAPDIAAPVPDPGTS
jgi:hypothetical protein